MLVIGGGRWGLAFMNVGGPLDPCLVVLFAEAECLASVAVEEERGEEFRGGDWLRHAIDPLTVEGVPLFVCAMLTGRVSLDFGDRSGRWGVANCDGFGGRLFVDVVIVAEKFNPEFATGTKSSISFRSSETGDPGRSIGVWKLTLRTGDGDRGGCGEELGIATELSCWTATVPDVEPPADFLILRLSFCSILSMNGLLESWSVVTRYTSSESGSLIAMVTTRALMPSW
jgi:hypothetical protein